MPPEDFLEFLGPDDIRLRGHRLGLEHVFERYQDGYTPEQIAEEFPGLSRDQIEGVIRYYVQNQADVDAYLARVQALTVQRMRQADLAAPPAVVHRLRALKATRPVACWPMR